MEWSTTDLRSPDCSAEPERSTNFFCLRGWTRRDCMSNACSGGLGSRSAAFECKTHCSADLSASGDGAQVPLVLRRQRSPRVARIEVTNVRRRGWSGWLVDSELASPSAESADCAAEMVAETWSLGTGREVDAISMPAICAVALMLVGSERTDICK